MQHRMEISSQVYLACSGRDENEAGEEWLVGHIGLSKEESISLDNVCQSIVRFIFTRLCDRERIYIITMYLKHKPNAQSMVSDRDPQQADSHI